MGDSDRPRRPDRRPAHGMSEPEEEDTPRPQDPVEVPASAPMERGERLFSYQPHAHPHHGALGASEYALYSNSHEQNTPNGPSGSSTHLGSMQGPGLHSASQGLGLEAQQQQQQVQLPLQSQTQEELPPVGMAPSNPTIPALVFHLMDPPGLQFPLHVETQQSQSSSPAQSRSVEPRSPPAPAELGLPVVGLVGQCCVHCRRFGLVCCHHSPMQASFSSIVCVSIPDQVSDLCRTLADESFSVHSLLPTQALKVM